MNDRFFDTHAHLDGEAFMQDLDATLERAAAAGVTDLVCIGASDGMESNTRAICLAEKFPQIRATVGVHPHDARIVDSTCLEEIERLAMHPRVVGIGETGLDYYYEHSSREAQAHAFRSFLQLAKRRELPCIVHTRDAEEDTMRILEEERAEKIRGVFHCFSGSERLAHFALDLGWYLSFSGVLTFKNAEPLRAIAKNAVRNRILVETDCPYLAPVPMRGKRNEPAFVLHTTQKLAELWGVDLESAKRITAENAVRLFDIP